MGKIIDFFKQHSWIWIIVVVVIAVIGDAVITQRQAKPTATPTPVPKTADFKTVIPGVSSEADLNKILGTPVKTTISGNLKTDEYKSTSELRLHSALVENGTVTFIKEIVSAHDTTTAADIIAVYGRPPVTLFNKMPNATFDLYVYPANGIAYVGHSDGTLLEIWYFVPTSIENFMNQWGKDYTTSQPAPIQ